jgi:pyruvate/2-oxoglutarate dehydrogenase complex dihydrolipoamide dehydrogenase (E3) component
MTDRPDSPEPIQDDLDLDDLADQMREHVEIRDRTYHLKTYSDCFVGIEAVDWLVSDGVARDREQAVMVGNVLYQAGYFHHVTRDHEFKDDDLFYRFAVDEDHGRKKDAAEGGAISWSEFLGPATTEHGDRQPRLADYDEDPVELDREQTKGIEPPDEHNTELLEQVHPRNWVNPEPEDRYNMVVIGAGTGGLVTAAAVAGLGGKVALVEKHLMGGDCLNFGCVPSKALLRCARAAANVRDASQFGVHIDGDVRIEFGEVMERLRRIRAEISHHDSAERFARELGVDVFIGHGQFTGANTVEVDGTELQFAKACIATGGSPGLPPIAGLEDAPHFTNMDLFNLTERPPRFGVIGGGVIGSEMAQAFARLGSSVTLFELGDRILAREDADAASIVQESLEDDGVEFVFGANIERVSHEPPPHEDAYPSVTLHLADRPDVTVDALLVATGRRPNVDGLGLQEAGVEFDMRTGVVVDNRLRTTNTDVFAVGDVATKYRFTHAADFMARMVVRNALFFGRENFDDLLIPWCTYTDPEVAHVGLYPRDLEDRGFDFDTFTREFADVDRAKLEGDTDGFVRIHVASGSDEILGATIVGPHAGDLISEITLAMQTDTGLGTLANVIHPYPTIAEAIRQSGDNYNRTRLTTTVKKLMRQVLSLRR